MSDTLAIASVADQTFDYIVAGGGTAGLTVATRLSEDPAVSVLVLEAGPANLDDEEIVVVAQFGKTFGNPKYDWAFETTEQRYANDRKIFWSRGKGLGGSSGMNFYAWVKPPAADMNAIESLGNPGWGWDDFLKYSKKCERFIAPGEEQLSKYPYNLSRKSLGSSGPIQLVFPPVTLPSIDTPIQAAMRNKGLKALEDPYNGDNSGVWVANSNMDLEAFGRSYAGNAYYQANKNRPNLTVLTEATVTKVILAEGRFPGDKLTATGVEFRWGAGGAAGTTYVAHARKEVVVAAGTLKSPQILELSGIGRRDVLGRIGVDVRVDLPGVGENVQEHILDGVSFELKDDVPHVTLDMMRDPEYAAEQKKLYAEHKGMHGFGLSTFTYFPLSLANPREAPSIIAKVEEEVGRQKASGKLAPGLAEQYDVQLGILRDDAVPDLEIAIFPGFLTQVSVPEPGKKYVTLVMVLNHPFSRGTIHSVSKDPLQNPEMDPHNFENDFDLELMVQHAKFAKSMINVEPWKSTVAREVDPGPQCSTDEQIREYIKNTHGTCWHTTGSCSMLPREKLGVVDPELKVYGTTNLRVVDLSIVPIQIAAHTQSMAYVVGEKAADLIRGAK